MKPFHKSSEDPIWQAGDAFHRENLPVYDEQPPASAYFKQADRMAHVCYQPAHPNPDQIGVLAGQGRNFCKWIACEQGEQAEGHSQSSLDGVLDSVLEPEASVGWHTHVESEEIYYLLEGQLRIWLEDSLGQQQQFELEAGDSHRVGPGMAHAAQAGANGARFIAIINRVSR